MLEKCVEAYSRLKNLKLVGDELGIRWQTVYVHLRKSGVKVTGDKARYGSVTDRLATRAERLFASAVPFAVDSNNEKFQAAIDFTVLGWDVDVKASRCISHKGDAPRWAFCINKQKDKADFFALYALDLDLNVKYVFLIPNEIATTSASISIPASLKSKWADYMVEESDLAPFFEQLGNKTNSAPN